MNTVESRELSYMQTMSNVNAAGGEYDVFLSHATPDKAWVRTLADELQKLGLGVFLDVTK